MSDKKFSFDLIFILSLFALFTVTAVSTVLIGIRIYSRTAKAMDANYETRTFASYLTQKVRQYDTAQGISVVALPAEDGSDTALSALCLRDQSYCTYLYLFDGYLRELTVPADTVFLSYDAGQKILPGQELSMETQGDHLLILTYATAPGERQQCRLAVRSQIGGQP